MNELPDYLKEVSTMNDHFKECNDSRFYDYSTINRLYRTYDLVTEDAGTLILHMLAKLSDYVRLMELNNQVLVDEARYQNEANRLFYEIKKAISALKAISDTYPDVYQSAMQFARGVVQFHADELSKHEPDSIALKWYREYGDLG